MVTVELPCGAARGTGDAKRTPRVPTVLLLAANPVELPPLQLGEECRIIEDSVHAGAARKQIRFRVRWAAHPDHLLLALNEDRPSVLQFSGHGNVHGLCFQAEDGCAQAVGTDALATVMRAAGASVSVVLLSACYSEAQAVLLATCVPCVIGWSSALGDKAALAYARAFYRALAFGNSVANAHEQGLAALVLPTVSRPTRDISSPGGRESSSIPRLLTRSDIDANNIYLVRSASKSRCTVTIRVKLREVDPDALAHLTEELDQLVEGEGDVRLTVAFSPRSRKARRARTK